MDATSTGTQITIPTIGSRLTLTEDWHFTLYSESRNKNFWVALFGEPVIASDSKGPPNNAFWAQYTFWRSGKDTRAVILPAGSVLKISRMYIRQNAKDYDSITFSLEETSLPELSINRKKVKGRFWAKLGDVNRMVAIWDAATVSRNP